MNIHTITQNFGILAQHNEKKKNDFNSFVIYLINIYTKNIKNINNYKFHSHTTILLSNPTDIICCSYDKHILVIKPECPFYKWCNIYESLGSVTIIVPSSEPYIF